MASKIQLIFISLTIFVCCQIPASAQKTHLKLPDYIQKIFVEYDTCMTNNSIKNLQEFKSLFHKDVVDTISIIHDLHFISPKFKYANSPLTINEMNKIFSSPGYASNIRNTFLQFRERISSQSRYGYKLYQYRLTKIISSKKNKNIEFDSIPYYFSLLSYNDPNNPTIKRASIIKVSDKKTFYPSRYVPESLTFDYYQGISSLNSPIPVSNQSNQGFRLNANFLLSGKKYMSYYLQFGAGYSKSIFDINLHDFTESYNSIDIDGTSFLKHGSYSKLAQKTNVSFLEIPFSIKAQHYQYKKIFNVFALAGLSYYLPLEVSFSNTKGFAEYYGSYQFKNDFNIDLKNLPNYGFSKYLVNTSNNNYSIQPLISLNAQAGVNLRVNKKFSLEAGLGLKYFVKDISLKTPATNFSDGDGIVTPLIQKQENNLSITSLSFGLTYNIYPVRSPYYPIIDKRLLNLKNNKIKSNNLTSEKIRLFPASDFIMRDLKVVEYEYKINNQSLLKQGKIRKKSGNYYLSVKIPKESNYLNIVKPEHFNFWQGETETINDNELLSVDLNTNSRDINISKISDLEIFVLFKQTTVYPPNKFELYQKMIKRVNDICFESNGSDHILFANDTVKMVKSGGDLSIIEKKLIEIENQFSVMDVSLLEDYIKYLKEKSVITKRRNININIIYLYKDLVFNTFKQSSEFLQMQNRNVELISKIEKNVFGNDSNTIHVKVWSNFTPDEMNLLNHYKSINQNNWNYKIY